MSTCDHCWKGTSTESYSDGVFSINLCEHCAIKLRHREPTESAEDLLARVEAQLAESA